MPTRCHVIALFAIVLSSLFLSTAHADLVTFNNDAPGIYANPFTSADSALVRFSEVGSGAAGSVAVNPNLSTTNVLGTGVGPGAPDELLMEFLVPVTSLSFEIGQPSLISPKDGWLRVFNGATPIAETRVALDSDNLFNQVISYSGAAITSARYALVDPGSIDLGNSAEGIDNLNFTPSPIPVPAAFWLFGTALAGFVGMSRRRKVA